MTWGAFILYALPSLIMAVAGYFIPKIEIDIAFKYVLFAIISMLMLVFSHYFTNYLRRDDTAKFILLEGSVNSLKSKVNELETIIQNMSSDYELKLSERDRESSKDIDRKDIEHARELSEINNKINFNLKNYPKSEAGNLWDEMNRVNDDIFNSFSNKMK